MIMASENDEPWAQLICSTNADVDPIYISKDIFVIGRAKDCDLTIPSNKNVSGKHCYIQRLSGGQVILHDTSTNGTLLNNKTKISKTGELLQHGDEFHIVYKKNVVENNLGYRFQDLAELEKEATDETQEYEISEFDQTISDEIESSEDKTPDRRKKRTADETQVDDTPAPKRAKSGDAVHTSQEAGPSGSDVKKEDEKSGEKSDKTEDNEKESVKDKTTDADEKSGDTCEESVMKDEGDKCKAAGPAGDVEEEDAIAETLICIICQEILHDCISLQPCMHSFCAGCYSDWMKMSNECPSCRLKVDRINKNHIVNNLVEAYLKVHPDKKRPDEDIVELEKKNQITRDMLYPKNRRSSDESGSGDDGDREGYSGSDDDDDDDAREARDRRANPIVLGLGYAPLPMQFCRQCPNYRAQPVPLNVGAPPFIPGALPAAGGTPGVTTAAVATGETAATAIATTAAATATTTTAAAATAQPNTPGDDAVPSTSGATGGDEQRDGATRGPQLKDEKVMPTAPAYVCRNNQTHAICLCCMQPMPDRRNDRLGNPNIPPQQCVLCYRFYCHAYWGCTRPDCLGCMNRFRDMHFGKKSLAGLLNDNAYESNVLKNYLEAEGISVRDMLQDCVAKMENGTYSTTDSLRGQLNGNTATCFACGLRNFKELVYLFRRDIPADRLPAEVTSRPDCYWGKNCRTQKNKPHHAERFNHICDQIRTS